MQTNQNTASYQDQQTTLALHRRPRVTRTIRGNEADRRQTLRFSSIAFRCATYLVQFTAVQAVQ